LSSGGKLKTSKQSSKGPKLSTSSKKAEGPKETNQEKLVSKKGRTKQDADDVPDLRTGKAEKFVEKDNEDMSKSDKGKLEKLKQAAVCRF
jgi:hypothetical protein